MLTLEEVVTIEVMKKQGRGLRKIAQELGVSRNTVRKYLRDKKLPQYGPRPPRPSKLDAFEPYLKERLALDPRLQASVLCREIRERGYDGAESMVRVRVAALKPKAPVAPGGQAALPVAAAAAAPPIGRRRLGSSSSRAARCPARRPSRGSSSRFARLA